MNESEILDVVTRKLSAQVRHPMRKLSPAMPLTERFAAIRANYRAYQARVDLKAASWMDGDPYETGDWVAMFTPIEAAAWSDIRAAGLPLWPQLPVGRFFVDFGNPVVKVALECDGRRWHNPERDRIRDRIMAERGWVIVRAPGWRCMNEVDRPDDGDPDALQAWQRNNHDLTMAGVIEDLKDLFRVRFS